MNWLSLLGIFAKPLGAAINNAISAGAGAAILWSTQHGIDSGIATPVIGALTLAISTAISGFAATQGVQIPVINADKTNGVRVVNSNDAKAAGLPKQNAPLPHDPPEVG